MRILENEAQFLRKYRRQIEPMLKKRIEMFKEMVINEPDDEKRDKLIKWVKEFKNWLGALYLTDKDEKDKFTGI